MQNSDIPKKITIPFGKMAGQAFIRKIPNNTNDNAAASWEKGFPPDTFRDPLVDGRPPDGRDFNGVLFSTTSMTVAQSAFGIFPFDRDFANAIGGYPQNATVVYNGVYYRSTNDNNNSIPGEGGAWVSLLDGVFTTNGGTLKGDVHISSGSSLYTDGIKPQTDGHDILVIGQLNQSVTPDLNDNGNHVPTLWWVNTRIAATRSSLEETISSINAALSKGINAAWENAEGRVSKFGDNINGNLGITSGNSLFVNSIQPQTAGSPLTVGTQIVQSGSPDLNDNGNSLTTAWWVNTRISQDVSKAIPLAPNLKIVSFTTGVINDHAYVNFPSAFSGTPISINISSIGDLDNDTSTYNWSPNGCNVRIIDGPNGVNCSIIAIGPK